MAFNYTRDRVWALCLHDLERQMRTAIECRAKAVELSELAAHVIDVVLAQHLAETSADWSALAVSVAKMEEWEARFMGDQITPAPPKSSLLD